MVIEEKKSLAEYTTFGVQVMADYFVSIVGPREFKSLMRHPNWSQERYIIGGGSNILFIQDFSGLIIQNQIKGIDVIDEDEDSMTLQVGSGENWHELVLYSVDKNLWGLENLALIPGSVGASPVQNIGAYGVEAKDTITKVYAIDTITGEDIIFNNNECNFGYRNSIFKKNSGKYFITAVEFKLSKIPILNLEYGAITDKLVELNLTDPSARDMAETIIALRSLKLPAIGEIGMAGSFFKNPIIEKDHANKLIHEFQQMKQFDTSDGKVKISAGWLIDSLGYKGVQEGNVGTYQKHALVLVNYGDATGQEVWDFAQKIIDHVFDVFGITLEPEVIIK